MPNYVISRKISEHIKERAVSFANRALHLALQDFPLTTAQIQYGGVMLTEEQVDTLRRLDSEGVRTIEHHRQVRLALLHEKDFPELRRSVVLMLQLPEWIVVGRGTQWGISTTKFDASENHYLVPAFGNLDGHERKQLITWVNSALRQTRLYEIVRNCVAEVLEKYAPTSAHLHALWPTLTTLVDPGITNCSRDRKVLGDWAQRFRNPTRTLKRYQPEPRVLTTYTGLIQAADVAILAGMMLPPPTTNPTQIIATIEHWERLSGDPTFPTVLPDAEE